MQHHRIIAPGRNAVKRCLYCLHPYTGRARCCSDFCESKVRGRAAYVTRSRRDAIRKIMEAEQKRLRFVPQWRQVAMGDDTQLAVIFGTGPHPEPPRHDETLAV